MKLSEAVKPISYLKAHASELIREVSEHGKTLIITQNGEAKVVMQDLHSYEQTMESLAFLKMLAISANNKKEGNYKTTRQTFAMLDRRIREAD